MTPLPHLHRRLLAQLLRDFVHCDDPSCHGLSLTGLRIRLSQTAGESATSPTPTQIRLALGELPALIEQRAWQFTVHHRPGRRGQADRWYLALR